MPTINITEEEKKILTRILNEYYSELRMEISNTESWEIKENLKTEEEVINKVLKQLK